MKARLLIGAVTCAAMLAVLASVGGVTKARADNPGGLTCGGNVSEPLSGQFIGGVWEETDNHNCNSGKTYSWEVQFTTDGGNHYNDWSTDHIVSSGSCANGCIHHGSDSAAQCVTGSGIDYYRIKWWWANGANIDTASYTPNEACVKHTLMQR